MTASSGPSWPINVNAPWSALSIRCARAQSSSESERAPMPISRAAHHGVGNPFFRCAKSPMRRSFVNPPQRVCWM